MPVSLLCLPPLHHVNPFAYSCSFTLHISFEMAKQGGGQKQSIIKVRKKEKNRTFPKERSFIRTLVKSASRKFNFLISQQKHMLCVLNEAVLLSTQNIC